MPARFSLFKLTEALVRQYIERNADAAFTYPGVGMTADEQSPAGYHRSHKRIQLGSGEAAFNAACRALRQWKMFDLPWVSLSWPEAPIEPGEIVGVAIHALGLWSLNTAKIVYVADEKEPTSTSQRRFGFAYGTTADHAERGEERFLIDWRKDETVWYDLLAFSQPNHWLARLGGPMTRRLQTRFAVESLAAIERAVS